jgi:serine/threonine protein phosphatase 1
MLKTLPINTQGRDFVVGDLHGCFNLLVKVLDHVEFDEDKDRLISVGDLVDRGPHSLDCLDLIRQPWFHAVRGNHDEMMLGSFNGEVCAQEIWPQNGGRWADQLSSTELETLHALLPIADNLPYVITVNQQDGKKFHVVHAELDSPHNVLDDTVMADEELLREFAEYPCRDGISVQWCRNIFRPLYGKNITPHLAAKYNRGLVLEKGTQHLGTGLSTIFSGHTVMQQPTRVGPLVCIDTGAFLVGDNTWCGLTLAEPLTNRFWKATNEDVSEIELVTV